MSSWDDMRDAPDEVRSMLAQAKRSQSMTAAQQARNAAHIAKIAARPMVSGGLGPIAKGALWGGGLGLAALAVAALVIPRAVTRRAPADVPAVHAAPSRPVERVREIEPSSALPTVHEASPPIAAPSPAVIEPSATPPRAVEPATPPAAHPRVRAPQIEPPVETHAATAPVETAASSTGTGPSAGSASDALTREATILGRAQAVMASDPAAALAQLGEHLREFPRGQFAADREFLAVDALMRLGRRDEAQRRADALVADHPRSVYVARVRRMMERGESSIR